MANGFEQAAKATNAGLERSNKDASTEAVNFLKVMNDTKASPEAKLKAAEDLYGKAGSRDIKIDGFGSLSIDVETTKSGKKMVHVFANDARGNSTVMLRGIDKDGQGHFEKERSANGKEVDYQGARWSSEAKNKEHKFSLPGLTIGEAKSNAAEPVREPRLSSPWVNPFLTRALPEIEIPKIAPRPAKAEPHAANAEQQATKPPVKTEATNNFARRVHAEDKNEIRIDQVGGRAPLSFHKGKGEIDYQDANGNNYILDINKEKGIITAYEIKDGKPSGNSRAWYPNGNELRVSEGGKVREALTSNEQLLHRLTESDSGEDLVKIEIPDGNGGTQTFTRDWEFSRHGYDYKNTFSGPDGIKYQAQSNAEGEITLTRGYSQDKEPARLVISPAGKIEWLTPSWTRAQ